MNLREALYTMNDIEDIWVEFARSLRWNNRFFPPERFNSLFKAIIEKAHYTAAGVSTMYRARIITPSLVKQLNLKTNVEFEEIVWGKNGLCGLPDKEMGAPPKGCASAGRANPAGISYLYLADSPITACSELRPILSDLISVGEFKVAPNLHLVDLRNLEETFDIGTLDGGTCKDARVLVFLQTLCNSFSEPVNTKDDLGYLPTQYIASYWKHLGADGIIFDSHMNSGNNGYNMVLFDVQSASFIPDSAVIYRCTQIQSDFQNISLGTSDPITAKTKDSRLEWNSKVIIKRDIANIKRTYGGE